MVEIDGSEFWIRVLDSTFIIIVIIIIILIYICTEQSYVSD